MGIGQSVIDEGIAEEGYLCKNANPARSRLTQRPQSIMISRPSTDRGAGCRLAALNDPAV